MSHANAALTPRARLRLAKLIVEEHWPVATAAKMFMLSPPTARKWAPRFRAEGPAGKADRSSRPSTTPTRTPPAVVKQIVAARWRRRLGPTQIAGELGMPASTVSNTGSEVDTETDPALELSLTTPTKDSAATPLHGT